LTRQKGGFLTTAEHIFLGKILSAAKTEKTGEKERKQSGFWSPHDCLELGVGWVFTCPHPTPF
jgi:hypothetical protein